MSNGSESETPASRGDSFKSAMADETVCAFHLTKGDRPSVEAVVFKTCDVLLITLFSEHFRQMLNWLLPFFFKNKNPF